MAATSQRTIAASDLLDPTEYAKIRVERRREMTRIKLNRRVSVGPFATFLFENFDTIRHQIQEMLHIEKGGAAQIVDEIEAYEPLIPKGNEIVATVLFEIDEPIRRARALVQIGGIENHAFVRIGEETIHGIPDPVRENTSPEGKASSVQFFNFRFSPAQADAFATPGVQILLGFDHPNYGHIAVLPEVVRAALAGDL